MHIIVGKLTIIGSENDLSPRQLQVIIWTSAGILLIVPIGTTFSEIAIEIHTFPFIRARVESIDPISTVMFSESRPLINAKASTLPMPN